MHVGLDDESESAPHFLIGSGVCWERRSSPLLLHPVGLIDSWFGGMDEVDVRRKGLHRLVGQKVRHFVFRVIVFGC